MQHISLMSHLTKHSKRIFKFMIRTVHTNLCIRWRLREEVYSTSNNMVGGVSTGHVGNALRGSPGLVRGCARQSLTSL